MVVACLLGLGFDRNNHIEFCCLGLKNLLEMGSV